MNYLTELLAFTQMAGDAPLSLLQAYWHLLMHQ